MFSVQNYDTLADTRTGLPLAEIFHQATSTKGGAFGLVFMVWVALGPCVIGSQLSKKWTRTDQIPVSDHCRHRTGILGFLSWQWSPAFPYVRSPTENASRLLILSSWARVNPRLGSPFNAQLCVGVIIALLGCIYLGSSTAFNSMMGSAVYAWQRTWFGTYWRYTSTINNLAYVVPILTNVLLRRRTMHRGPFSMGQFTGMAVNIISVMWLVFAIVFFSFPFEMPATGECYSRNRVWLKGLGSLLFTNRSLVSNMNYTCVVVGGFLIIELVWWIIAGKKYSQTVQRAREEHDTAMVVQEQDKMQLPP